jgi:hypothetical protein
MEKFKKSAVTEIATATSFSLAATLFLFNFYAADACYTPVQRFTGIAIIKGDDIITLFLQAGVNHRTVNRLQYFYPGIWAILSICCAAGGAWNVLNKNNRTGLTTILFAVTGAASLIVLKLAITAAYNLQPVLHKTVFMLPYWLSVAAFAIAALAGCASLAAKEQKTAYSNYKKQHIIGSLIFPFTENKN